MARYRVQDETWGDNFTAEDDDAALAHAEQWLRGGDWERDHTLWLSAQVFSVDDDGKHLDTIGTVRVTLHPDVPRCAGGAHVWCSPYEVLGGLKENPGVWGSGGGVIIKEVCSECGTYKVTDTWATNPCDGTQGHTSVEYLPATEKSLEWVQQLGQPEEVTDGND